VQYCQPGAEYTVTTCAEIGVVEGLNEAAGVLGVCVSLGPGVIVGLWFDAGKLVVGILLGVGPVQEAAAKAVITTAADNTRNTLRITILRITTIHHSILNHKSQI
jgi:hypothetical protein